MSYENLQVNKLQRLERAKAQLVRNHVEILSHLNREIESLKQYFRLASLTEGFPILLKK